MPRLGSRVRAPLSAPDCTGLAKAGPFSFPNHLLFSRSCVSRAKTQIPGLRRFRSTPSSMPTGSIGKERVPIAMCARARYRLHSLAWVKRRRRPASSPSSVGGRIVPWRLSPPRCGARRASQRPKRFPCACGFRFAWTASNGFARRTWWPYASLSDGVRPLFREACAGSPAVFP